VEATGTPTVIDTPLAAMHRAAGANLGVWFGCALPDDFGDWQREYSFAKKNVALIDASYRTYVSFAGPDRTRYLNAILTNNIKDLHPGNGNISLLLNPQGRILAEIETHARPDTLFCISHAMIGRRLVETLDKFIIMDDVALADETQRYGTLSLVGPGAAKTIAEVVGVELASIPHLSSVSANIGSVACTITRRTFGTHAVADILASHDDLKTIWQFLVEKTRSAGGGPVGYKALNALRLEQALPWFGYDFGEKQIPHEAGLQDSHISYTKGCYTGQEIVERVRSRGQVNRRRVLLKFAGAELPRAGETLTAAEKEVGSVTSASPLPSINNSSIGMGYLRKESATPGSEVDWPGGTATVVETFDAK
jgi:folate-binding protein YgfZ